MQHWGRTARGRQRFHCPGCKATKTCRRPDLSNRLLRLTLKHWLTGSLGLAELARQRRVTPRTLQRRLRRLWRELPIPRPMPPASGLILDATHVIGNRYVVLVVQDIRRYPVTWAFAERETFESWWRVLDALRAAGMEPRFVVGDGHTGLLKALRLIWPQVLIQRCLLHVMRQARLDLTQNPRTLPGQALLDLVKRLREVRTRRQRRRWHRAYRQWLCRHDAFLKERTVNPAGPRRWWYTHRKLRAVRSQINNSLPDLFHYIRYPEIPRTTNHVEGGINSRLKDLFRRHRGLSATRKITLTAWYLHSRQTTQKPTRNVV